MLVGIIDVAHGWPRNTRTRRDAAVAAVMAHDRAAALVGAARDSIYI
jgi:hypothetical protein